MNPLFFIPARGGSKGILNKNLQLIGEKSLTEIAIDFLCQAGFEEFTVLSSDSEKILETCRVDGIFCDKRPESFSGDEVTTAATIKEFIESGRGKYNLDQDDWIIIVEPTSPFRRLETLRILLDVIKSNKFDSIFTVYKSSAVEWFNKENFWSRKDNADGIKSRRQTRLPKYHECGVFYATKVKNIMAESILGDYCHCIEVDSTEALDINSQLDLEVCRAVFNLLQET